MKIGDRFGRLTFMGPSDRTHPDRVPMYAMKCDCGTYTIKSRKALSRGRDLLCLDCHANEQVRAQRKAAERRRLMRQTEDLRQQCRKETRRLERHGVLVKPDSCDVCGQPHHRITGHHEDYDRPRFVIYLCPSCHGKRHARLRMQGRNPTEVHHRRHTTGEDETSEGVAA